MERKISVFILIILLACAFKIRVMTNANGVNPGPGKQISNTKDTKGSKATITSTGWERNRTDEGMDEANGTISYDEIRKYVDKRLGSFKSANYIPNSVSIREYDGGQTAVKNSLIDITYQTQQGESHKQVRKIDVFVKNGNNWIKADRERMNSATAVVL